MALFQDYGAQIAQVIQQASAQIVQANQFQQRLQLEREQMQQQNARQAEVFKMQQDKLKLEQELFKLDVSKQARLQQEADTATARAGLEMGKIEMEAYEREAARRDGAPPEFQGYTTLKELSDYVKSTENALGAESARSFGETTSSPNYQAREAAVARAKGEQQARALWLKNNRPAPKIANKATEDELTRLAAGGGATSGAVMPTGIGDVGAMHANLEAYNVNGDFAPVYRDLEAAHRRGPDAVDALFSAYANIFPGGREGLARMVKETRSKAK